jgi:hypothetical protein
MALLNVNNSIVDYLKSQKQDSSYSARTKLYGSSDLNSRLGDYVGSSQQNTALLNYLKKQSQPEVTQAPDTGAAGAQNYLNEQGSATPNANVINYLTTKYGRTPTTAELTEYFRPKTAEEQRGLPSNFMTAEQVYQKQLSEGYFDENLQAQKQSEAEAAQLEQIKSTPEYKLQEEEATAQREGITRALQQAVESTQKTYESRGISSSGLKAKAITDAEAEASAQQLGIDRGLAKIVLQAIRDDQSAQAKAQEEQNKAQTEALKAAGYVNIGGTIYPTLERQRYESSNELSEARLDIQEAQSEFNNEVAMLKLEQAQQRIDNANETLELKIQQAGLTNELNIEKLAIQQAQLELAQARLANTQDQVKKDKEKALGGIRANIYSWVSADAPTTRDALIEQLVGLYGDIVPREEISTEVYGITTPYEGKLKGLKKSK